LGFMVQSVKTLVLTTSIGLATYAIKSPVIMAEVKCKSLPSLKYPDFNKVCLL
jgi:hypothetical protein